MEQNWENFFRGLLSKALIALCGAIFGYFVNYFTEHRQRQIQQVSQQLEVLYKPLRDQLNLNIQTWNDFRAARFPNRMYFFDGTPLSKDDIDVWRDFMKHTFQPQNQKMSRIITDHAALFAGGKTPIMFILVTAHTEAYNAVMARWAHFDTNLEHNRAPKFNTTLVNFPNSEKLLKCLDKQISALEQVSNQLRDNPIRGLIDTVQEAVPPVCNEPTIIVEPAE